jgi:LmbE family N-acetylglucosaminyl deacetylase
MAERAAIAIAAHPDDIEFTMAGTLLRLREAGWKIHCLNVSSGDCGSLVHGRAALRRIRAAEARRAAAVLGAVHHPSLADDIGILYGLPLLRRLAAVIREVRPAIVLTHPPQDYMEDHTETCRLAVSAAVVRGIPNFASVPRCLAWSGETVIYHAMPHGLHDPLRRRVVAGAWVDTTAVHARKLEALACHESQHAWLRASQGMNSYLRDMERMSRAVGRQSGRFRHAEGWRRHSHPGFSATDTDPLRAALGPLCRVNATYERALRRGAP